MKTKLLTLIFSLIFITSNAQFTDPAQVALQTKILLVNGKIATSTATSAVTLKTLNKTLLTTNKLLAEQNTKLGKLISLLNKNNTISESSRKIHQTELTAKKVAPGYVFDSAEVDDALELKSSILRIVNSSKDAVNSMKYITSEEKTKFVEQVGRNVNRAVRLFNQSRKIVTTSSIINPEERLKKVSDINASLKSILREIEAASNTLKSRNANRATQNTLKAFGKNEKG